MQKNPGENFTTVEVDPVTGEYYITLPEWVVSEYGWYEGTEVNMEVDGDCIVITEVNRQTIITSHSIITIESIHIQI